MLHAIVRGEGGPPVVMEAGTWDLALTWSKVQPEVAASTIAVAYDRAGLGWSDTSPAPRTAGSMVDELRALPRHRDVERVDTMIAELEGLAVSQDEVRAARDAGLGDIPLVVISHGEPAPLPPIVHGGHEVAEACEATWHQMQTGAREPLVRADAASWARPACTPSTMTDRSSWSARSKTWSSR